ncbi:MAG: hypothetical protein ABIH92_05325 [Nanoarchaeota archaeon]
MRIPKKGALVGLFITLTFFLISNASAELLFGQTESLYNVGDKFDISIKVSPQTYASNFLSAKLICEGKEIELFRSPLSVEAGGEEEIIISTNLDNFLIGGVKGFCFLKASFGDEVADSQKFEVTNEVGVTLNIEGILFNPRESVNVHGQAKKANGVPLEGFVEVSIPGIDFSYTGQVASGEFNFNFTIPSNAPSGGYTLEVRAYEKDIFGSIINEGTTASTVRIKQIIRELEVALNDQSVTPVEELTYSIIVYDQAKEHAEADVSIVIYRPDGTVLEKKIVRAEETNAVSLESNAAPGYWRIEAKLNELETTKEFLIEEFKDVSFSLENQTLVIENTGNVPYNGPVEITIGGINEVKELDLPLGESKKFKLLAPDGEYNIEVGKGSKKQELGTTFLTGKAISVEDIGGDLFGTSFVILLGLITILVIAVVVVYFYKKISRDKASPLGKSTISKKPGKTGPEIIKSASKELPGNVIDKGEKQESSIISLKIKNMQELGGANSEAMKSIDSALWRAKEAGAKIYSDGDFRIMIFAPILTQEKDNSVIAIRSARTIERVLHSHNRRASPKINFGLAANLGNLIVESKEGKFRFMSLNNIIATTKRLSEESNAETLISESLRKKTVGRVKAEKLKDKNLWKVEKVIDRAAYSDHIRTLTRDKGKTDPKSSGQPSQN